MWAYWVPMLVFETVLFALAIAKAFEEFRRQSHTPRILIMLFRDSVAYFGGVLAVILANLVIWSAARVRRSGSYPRFSQC